MARLPRCSRCNWIESICACRDAPGLALSTRVTLVMHVLERKIKTNTGALVRVALQNVGEVLRGVKDQPIDPAAFAPEGYQTILLYRDEHARELTKDAVRALRVADPRPINLAVIDSSWAQSKKFRNREAVLKDLPCFILPPGEPSRYRLRREPFPDAVSTFEAVARALGVLESESTQWTLESYFDRVIDRTIAHREGRGPV